MHHPPANRPFLPLAAWFIAGVFLALHLLPRPGYGFHRDELLYLAMGDHLDLLRMQFPPLIAVLGRLAKALPLDTLAATRLLAALAGTAVLVIGVAITRRMGGGREAQILAALALAVGPFSLRTATLFQPVVFEVLWWSLAAWAFVALLGDGDRRWWIVFGVAAGLGGLTKFSAAIFGGAMALAVFAGPLRKDFLTRWPWIAVLIGGAIALPSVLGQIHWDWPFLAQQEILRETQLARVTPGSFLTGQLFLTGAAAPLLLAGAIAIFTSKSLRRFRSLGIAVAAALVFLLLLKGKEYYFGPMHPPLLAAGSVVVGKWLTTRRWAWRGVLLWGAAGGAFLLPMGIPLLPPAQMARYAEAIGQTRAVTTNMGTVLPLPQDYADMIGWREQVADGARIYHGLPESERAGAVVLGGNYGRAGALAVYHQEFDLPYPISRHGDFWAWGPEDGGWAAGPENPTVIIIVGGSVEELEPLFEDVVEGGRSLRPLGVGEEQDVGIHICRGQRAPLRQLWERLGPVWG
jgi:4-amino-4-deoxy-L-arabinose transferase-like glycosyltransferase